MYYALWWRVFQIARTHSLSHFHAADNVDVVAADATVLKAMVTSGVSSGAARPSLPTFGAALEAASGRSERSWTSCKQENMDKYWIFSLNIFVQTELNLKL